MITGPVPVPPQDTPKPSRSRQSARPLSRSSCQQPEPRDGRRSEHTYGGPLGRRCGTLRLYPPFDLFESYLWPVELWGFEPQTSCMPSGGSTSARIHPRRSPSQSVLHDPPPSAPVAVLFCCTASALICGCWS